MNGKTILILGGGVGGVCAHCGYSLQVNFAYCPNCGLSLRSVTYLSCEQAVDPAWKSCPFCGTALGANVPALVGHAHHE